jgi:hypothetical protein
MDTPPPFALPSLVPQHMAEDALDALLAQVSALSDHAGREAPAPMIERAKRVEHGDRDAPIVSVIRAIAQFARDGGPPMAIPDQLESVRDALYSRALQRRTLTDPDGAAVEQRSAALGYVLTVTKARHALALGSRISVRQLAALGGVSSRQLLEAMGLEPEPGLRIDPLSARRWLRSVGVKGYT